MKISEKYVCFLRAKSVNAVARMVGGSDAFLLIVIADIYHIIFNKLIVTKAKLVKAQG